jgi:class 3 adenylate cyclase
MLLCIVCEGRDGRNSQDRCDLAADVVGFSRMANANEDRTLAWLRTLRSELIDPTVASQNGRVFKRTGDGALVEFRSVASQRRPVAV